MPVEKAASGATDALRAAHRLLVDSKQRKRIEAGGVSATSALDELGLTEDAVPPLLTLLNAIDVKTKGTKPPRDEKEAMLLEAFDHIRASFWVSLLMSTLIFLVGLALLGVSVWLALRAQGGMSWSALTVGGLGIADFAMLFYSRPWKDIAANLANSQQTRMIVTAYLAGYALLPEGNDRLQKLQELTEKCVAMIQKYTEDECGRSGSDRKALPNG